MNFYIFGGKIIIFDSRFVKKIYFFWSDFYNTP